MIVPTTRVYILRLISFSPSKEKVENQIKISTYDWQLKGINTTDLDFNTTKGKVVIVNYWATWCTPCIAEMPSLQNLYNDYKDRVVFVLVSTEESNKILPFMEKKQFNLPIYNPISQNPSELNTDRIPKTFLIDKNGKIIIEVGRADWNTRKIRKIIDELIAE